MQEKALRAKTGLKETAVTSSTRSTCTTFGKLVSVICLASGSSSAARTTHRTPSARRARTVVAMPLQRSTTNTSPYAVRCHLSCGTSPLPLYTACFAAKSRFSTPFSSPPSLGENWSTTFRPGPRSRWTPARCFLGGTQSPAPSDASHLLRTPYVRGPKLTSASPYVWGQELPPAPRRTGTGGALPPSVFHR